MKLSASYQLIWLILLLGHTEARTRPVLRVSPHSWAAEGDSVTLSCEVTDSSIKWTFLWYKTVPFRRTVPFNEDSPIFDDRKKPHYVELLSDSSRGAGGFYTLSPAALQHTGSYVCRAEGGDPAYQTDFSEIKNLWVTGVSPPASLVIRPNRTQLFYSESVSLSCEVQDSSTGWRLRWRTKKVTSVEDREDNLDCPYGWYSESGTTCRTKIQTLHDSGVYWCESEFGQYSNAVNISINWKPKSEIRNPPHSWAAEGDSVTLSCEVTDASFNWTFLWYKAVRTGEDYYREGFFIYDDNYYAAELLPDSSRGAGGSYTLSPAAPRHTGSYVCRAEGGDPAYQTGFSNVVALWVTGLSPPASLVIRPNRPQQLYVSESVSLSCEGRDKSTRWRLRWSTGSENDNVCPNGWTSEAGPTCTNSRIQSADAGVYWCETESGQYSNAFNVSIKQKPIAVLSASTDSWLAEGNSVTLSCEVSDTSLKWKFLWYRAVPYKKELPRLKHGWINYNAKLLSDSSRGAGGSYTLSPAALQHTGLYVCRAEGGDPAYQTEFSNVETLWVVGLSPPASLVIRPNRTQLYEYESLSLSCEGQDSSTEWRLRWIGQKEEGLGCPKYWRLEAGSTCSTSELQPDDSGVYWCESESGEHSNPFKLRMNLRPRPFLHVSPHSWPVEGDSVTLNCKVTDTSLGWTFLWYRAVPKKGSGPFTDDSTVTERNRNRYSVELLSDSSRGAGGSYTLSPVALQHTGLYVCRAEGGDPAYQTMYSNMKPLRVIGVSPPATLVIRPNKTDLFASESVSLSCEVKDKSTGWRLRWDTNRREESVCPASWRSEAELTCSTIGLQYRDRGVYWCESESGQHSNAAHIKILYH
ncbi:Fc receptor-like protein 5 isoform X2 [Alosa alosa]|uniref:Fc receptor-like protein 5 isoform X2 n=1 Tax=Alosa alosa TaxID=278164 RepID=UPI0020151D2F|nr:Fc receptor-like protein 5 isoform X2 [Alosa alosa]